MKRNACLGIHYSPEALRAVVVEKRGGGGYRPGESWRIAAEGGAGADHDEQLVARAAAQMGEAGRNPAVAVALGGRLYQTELHHSEFEERKQLDQTLRYDVEEDFMMDLEETAFCYQVRPGSGAGTDVLVYTTAREPLAALLERFDEAGLDALAVEPDLAAWVRYLAGAGDVELRGPTAALGWAEGVLYLLLVDGDYGPIMARSYVCPGAEQAGGMLGTEMKRTLALLSKEERPGRILYHGGPMITPYIYEHGTLLFSVDPVALDQAGVELIRRARRTMAMPDGVDDGISVGYLDTAHAMGLGYNDLNFIDYQYTKHEKF